MINCLDVLFDQIYSQRPYCPQESSERINMERMAQARKFLEAISPECANAVFDLEDCHECLASDQIRHAFSVGLDLGLSLARELRLFQSED